MEMLEHRLVLSTFWVSNTADSGEGSLRWAIEQANGTSQADAITFDASLADQPIVLGGTELSISDDLTITGLGADDLTISGNNLSRVFSIAEGANVVISGVAITGGKAEGGGAIYNQGTLKVADSIFTGNSSMEGSDGGAIYNEATLTVETSQFTGNSATKSAYGGAICNWVTEDGIAPSLTVTNCDFTSNSNGPSGWGGAIANVNNRGNKNEGGTVVITGSTFSKNWASSSGGAVYQWSYPYYGKGTIIITASEFTENNSGWGGALYVSDVLAEIGSSTFSDNTASSFGGAIFTYTRRDVVEIKDSTLSGNSTGKEGGAIDNNGARLTITNSTISGNSTNGVGGAIYNNYKGNLDIRNSTITANRADADGQGGGSGGALYDDYDYGPGTFLFHNTIVAGNVVGPPGSDSPNEFRATLDDDSSHNLIGDAATAGGLVHGADGNIVGDGGSGTINITTVLDPNLANNGGPTLTHALVPDGPAVNAGDNSKAVDSDGNPLDYDQRGEGFVRIVDGMVDIGAFEVQPQILSVEIDVKPGSDPNSINLASKGVIAVAIFTTAAFDASLVNASTVVFAGANAVHWALEDTDGDGDLDMVLHFRVQDTNLADVYAQLVADDLDEDGVLDSNHQAATVSLTGLTATDEYFQGFDEVDLFLSGKHLRDLLEDLAANGVI